MPPSPPIRRPLHVCGTYPIVVYEAGGRCACQHVLVHLCCECVRPAEGSVRGAWKRAWGAYLEACRASARAASSTQHTHTVASAAISVCRARRCCVLPCTPHVSPPPHPSLFFPLTCSEHVVHGSHAVRAVQVRLLTDLFSVLIPGIQTDYPHRSIALTMAATAEPAIVFLAGEGARFEGAYETHVHVLPPSDGMHGAHAMGGVVPDEAVEVAVLTAEVSGVVDLKFKKSKVSDLKVRLPNACVPGTLRAAARVDTCPLPVSVLSSGISRG